MSSRTRKLTIITALTTIPITGITGGRILQSRFHLDLAAAIGAAIMAVIITAVVTEAAVSMAVEGIITNEFHLTPPKYQKFCLSSG